MKLTKIFAFALAALTMTACSDDKVDNGADVTVGFAETAITVLESSIKLNVPVVVTGDNKGDITVDVELIEVQPNPAMIDHNFRLTSTHLNIPAGVKSVDLEFLLRDDAQPNDDRVFQIKITNVTNATVGTNNTCTVTLKDNDTTPYFGLQGAWTIVYGNNQTQECVIEGVPEGQLGFGRRLILSVTMSNVITGDIIDDRIRLDYSYDESLDVGDIELAAGQLVAQYDTPPLSLGGGLVLNELLDYVTIVAFPADGDDYTEMISGSLNFNWDEDYINITCNKSESGLMPDTDYSVNIMLCTSSGIMFGLDYQAQWENMRLTR